ncbi:MAG: enoyl-CoA hydratase/isomerase family protein, partial [Desulfatirhabdiaceae bacterium]
LSIGLVDQVVPLAEIDQETNTLAGRLAKMPVMAIRAAKSAMRTGLNLSLSDGLQVEKNLFCMLFGTPDQTEGMAAFLEKRKPLFQ